MRKLIMYYTMILSLIAIVGVSFVLKDIFSFIQNLGNFNVTMNLEFVLSVFDTDFRAGVQLLGILAWAILQIYGIPLLVFLVSLNGLTRK